MKTYVCTKTHTQMSAVALLIIATTKNENTQMFNNWFMCKVNVAPLYNGILFAIKKWSTDLCHAETNLEYMLSERSQIHKAM